MHNECCNFPSPRERVKEKLKSSICCFLPPHLNDGADMEPLEDQMKSRTPRSPHVIKDKCRHLIARIGKRGRRQYHSSDFSYDPMSYALNFENESSRADELPIMNFMSRLPATPERTPEPMPVSVRREVFAYS
ncbi:hypothetical protein CCACVL1_23374 [Corchorus capsularis]|uniref:Uncharacterized protein n=1 Tax=Corchorus capsularis TaxID=210143 RepID=A0A1R3GU87_COCAP|nr:hypothetical protein CCACVL1_23374 [Corchorus capsularis]